MRKNLIRHTLPLAVVGCGAVVATLALAPAQAADPTLICGAYTQAYEDLAGCEILPGYTAVEVDTLAEMQNRIAALTDQVADVQQEVRPEFYEDGSWAIGGLYGCAPTALCDDDWWATQE